MPATRSNSRARSEPRGQQSSMPDINETVDDDEVLSEIEVVDGHNDANLPPNQRPRLDPRFPLKRRAAEAPDVNDDDDAALDADIKKRRLHLEAKRLQFEEERLARDIREFEATGATTSVEALGSESTYSAEILSVAQKMDVRAEYVGHIQQGSFKADNLSRLLHSSLASAHQDDAHTISFDGANKAFFKKTAGRISEFKSSISLWSAAFSTYIRIWSVFFASRQSDILLGMLHFQHDITELARSFNNELVITYAVNFMRGVLQGVPSAARWESADVANRSRIFHAGTVLPPAYQSNKHRSPFADPPPEFSPNDSSVICRNFNSTKGCTRDTCKRSHACSRCGAKHSATSPHCKSTTTTSNK